MKKIPIILLILVVTIISFIFIDCSVALINGRSMFFASSRGEKYEYIDEYMANLEAIQIFISEGTAKKSNDIKLMYSDVVSGDRIINIYIYNPNINIVVVIFSSEKSLDNNSIFAVSLNKKRIDMHKYNEKLNYSVILKTGYKFFTIKSSFLLLPGDIYRDGKVISGYTKEERENVIKNIWRHLSKASGATGGASGVTSATRNISHNKPQ